ncbi:MAG: DUF1292 domain-containing protein [Lachnospiraceae bacterium]|jgi:hypothetical protein|nr:DUF1292 domain-containing protein [Lachnospiraceae bacterium]MCI9589301.1 DUF1292 domain-containing protein [Lachnospiraceae bacterium]MDE6929937.1 DUF1292 domain-containing protein [Lachnospiraceae bacterium]
MNNREGMISMLTDDGSMVDFFVLEETRINGKNYLMVTDSQEEEDGECYILKDISRPEDSEAIYEFVEDDEELDFLYRIFLELVSDMEIDLKP